MDDIKAGSENAVFAKPKSKVASLECQTDECEGGFDVVWWLRERQDSFSDVLEGVLKEESPFHKILDFGFQDLA